MMMMMMMMIPLLKCQNCNSGICRGSKVCQPETWEVSLHWKTGNVRGEDLYFYNFITLAIFERVVNL